MAIRRHGVVPSALWGRPCTGFSVHVIPDEETRRELARLQISCSWIPDDLCHVIPSQALHVSVATLLGARETFVESKEAIWRSEGERCLDELHELAAVTIPFQVIFTDLMLTQTALIAVAADDGGMETLRRTMHSRISILQRWRGKRRRIVHTTLLRFKRQASLDDGVFRAVASVPVDIGFKVEEFVVRKERVFPSLRSDVLGVYPFRGRGFDDDVRVACR